MIHQPWLTIVTVVKDDEPGFRRTLDSLRGQDLDGIEYLVIDSSRVPHDIEAAALEAPVTITVTWKPPTGIYAAMNEGLARSRGDYVYFLNAGDELLHDALRRVRAGAHASPAWMFGEVEVISADGQRVVTSKWDYATEKSTHFSRGRFPSHQGTFARRELLLEVGGFDTDLSITADYAAALRLSTIADPVYIDGAIATFHEGGASTRKWHASVVQFHRARRRVFAPRGSAALRENWSTFSQFTRMAVYRSPWALTSALLVIGWLTMLLTGVPVREAVALPLLVGVQCLGGAICWRLMRPQRSISILEAVGMGLGLGTAASLLVGIFLPWWLFPVGAVVAWYALPQHRLCSVLTPLARPDQLALAIGLIPGLAAMAVALRAYPLTWVGFWNGYHGDMPFFEALSIFAARLGPSTSGFMTGADIRYHSLAYAWAGQLGLSVDAMPFVVLTRLVPLVALVAAIALAASWTRHFTRALWAPSLAVALIVTGGFVGATYGSVLNFDSPSQSMGVVWLLALSVVFLTALESPRWWWFTFPLIVLVIALTGGKISTAAIAGVGIGVVTLVALLRREPWRWRALTLSALAAFALVATYVILLAGSANSGGLSVFTLLDRASSVQGLNPVITPRGIIAGIALLLLAIIPRWAGLAWLIGHRPDRWNPATVYGAGLSAAAVLTIIMLSGGFNDLWFAVAASAPLAVLSAVGVTKAWQWLGPAAHRRAFVALLLGLAACLVVAMLWSTGSSGILGQGWRWFGPLAGIGIALLVAALLNRTSNRPTWSSAFAYAVITLVAMAIPARLVYAVAEPRATLYPTSWSHVLFRDQAEFMTAIDTDAIIGWSDSQAAAGTWLRQHSEVNDVVATNVTLSAIVPALSHRATYISDIHMQAPYGRAGDVSEIARREAASWDFVNGPSSDSLASLCNADVTWLWIDPRRTEVTSWEPYATVRWSSPDATILELNRSTCP